MQTLFSPTVFLYVLSLAAHACLRIGRPRRDVTSNHMSALRAQFDPTETISVPAIRHTEKPGTLMQITATRMYWSWQKESQTCVAMTMTFELLYISSNATDQFHITSKSRFVSHSFTLLPYVIFLNKKMIILANGHHLVYSSHSNPTATDNPVTCFASTLQRPLEMIIHLTLSPRPSSVGV